MLDAGWASIPALPSHLHTLVFYGLFLEFENYCLNGCLYVGASVQVSEGHGGAPAASTAEDIEDHNYDGLIQAACTLPEVIIDFGGSRARVLGGHCASLNAIFVTKVPRGTVPQHPSLQLKPFYESGHDDTGAPTMQLPIPVSRPPVTLVSFW